MVLNTPGLDDDGERISGSAYGRLRHPTIGPSVMTRLFKRGLPSYFGTDAHGRHCRMVHCAIRAGPDPAYVDTTEAIRAAAGDLFEQVKRLAGREQRQAREAELKADNAACSATPAGAVVGGSDAACRILPEAPAFAGAGLFVGLGPASGGAGVRRLSSASRQRRTASSHLGP